MLRASVIIAVALALGLASKTEAFAPPSLDVPRLGLHVTVSSTTLDAGPMWWPARGRPGCGCTIAIAGHRTTHTHPFLRINTLRSGDRITILWQGQRYVYRVTGSRVIPSTATHTADEVGHERLLLSACTPPGSAAYRLVVYALPERR